MLYSISLDLGIADAGIQLPCANIINGHYRYTSDLLALASSPSSPQKAPWPHYRSPVRLDLLRPSLEAHPDQAYASYISEGLSHGFRIGFNHQLVSLRSCQRNHPSCCAKPEVVKERISSELAAGRLLGPITPDHLPLVHCSPMGLVPKPHQPNKFRLIVDLSYPNSSNIMSIRALVMSSAL